MQHSNKSINGYTFTYHHINSVCVILFTFATQLNTNVSLTSATPFSVSYKQTFTNILIIKPTRCTNFSNLIWNKTTCFGQFLCSSSGVFHCTHSNGVCHTGLLTACEQDQDVPSWSCSDPACKLSANLYDIYHCCVYSEKLLMMDTGTVWNTQSFIPKINLRN